MEEVVDLVSEDEQEFVVPDDINDIFAIAAGVNPQMQQEEEEEERMQQVSEEALPEEALPAALPNRRRRLQPGTLLPGLPREYADARMFKMYGNRYTNEVHVQEMNEMLFNIGRVIDKIPVTDAIDYKNHTLKGSLQMVGKYKRFGGSVYIVKGVINVIMDAVCKANNLHRKTKELVFCDIGASDGRVLIAASLFPAITHVIGIEIDSKDSFDALKIKLKESVQRKYLDYLTKSLEKIHYLSKTNAFAFDMTAVYRHVDILYTYDPKESVFHPGLRSILYNFKNISVFCYSCSRLNHQFDAENMRKKFKKIENNENVHLPGYIFNYSKSDDSSAIEDSEAVKQLQQSIRRVRYKVDNLTEADTIKIQQQKRAQYEEDYSLVSKKALKDHEEKAATVTKRLALNKKQRGQEIDEEASGVYSLREDDKSEDDDMRVFEVENYMFNHDTYMCDSKYSKGIDYIPSGNKMVLLGYTFIYNERMIKYVNVRMDHLNKMKPATTFFRLRHLGGNIDEDRESTHMFVTRLDNFIDYNSKDSIAERGTMQAFNKNDVKLYSDKNAGMVRIATLNSNITSSSSKEAITILERASFDESYRPMSEEEVFMPYNEMVQFLSRSGLMQKTVAMKKEEAAKKEEEERNKQEEERER
jgi:hypothetical protein